MRKTKLSGLCHQTDVKVLTEMAVALLIGIKSHAMVDLASLFLRYLSERERNGAFCSM